MDTQTQEPRASIFTADQENELRTLKALADYRADLGYHGYGAAGDQARAILARCGQLKT